MQSLNSHSQRQRRQAFSLVEMLLVAAIMSVVIFGLYAMFDQTQKALRSNTTQVDVLEGGRAAMDLIARELGQCRVSDFGETVNLMAYSAYPRVGYPNALALDLLTNANAQYNIKWTNVLQDVFFLTQKQDEWFGCGYCVGSAAALPNQNNSGISNFVFRATNGWGQLYYYTYSVGRFPEKALKRMTRKFVTNAIFCFSRPTQTTNGYGRVDSRQIPSGSDDVYPWSTDPARNSELISFSPLIDGVVHFSIKAYDGHGQPMTGWGNVMKWWDASLKTNYQARLLDWNDTMPSYYAPGAVFAPYNVVIHQEQFLPTQSQVYFLSNAVPASVELELAVIEPKLIDRLKAESNPDRQRRYLEQHPGQVHLFRKRIPIRAATP
jgi:prepilin-type N-terminal cleavage/methylation domain-containing protein